MIPILAAALILAQPTSPLSGPAVAKPAERVTLVRYDFNSRLRRVETTPEAAAAGLLQLPPPVREKVDAVLARRAASIDAFVTNNLFLLQELDTAGKAGRKLDQVVLIARAIKELEPVLKPGPLEEQVAAVMPGEHAGRFRALVDEYWSAAAGESLHDARRQGKKDPRWAMDLGERFRHLGEEIARSFERQVASGTLFIDYFLNDLDLSAEQKSVIEGLKLDMLQKSGMKPGEKEQIQLVVGTLAYLNEGQRARVVRRLKGK